MAPEAGRRAARCAPLQPRRRSRRETAMAALIFLPTASTGPSPARSLRSRPFPSSAGLPCLRTASLLSSSRCSPSPAPVASSSASASSRRRLQPHLLADSAGMECRMPSPPLPRAKQRRLLLLPQLAKGQHHHGRRPLDSPLVPKAFGV